MPLYTKRRTREETVWLGASHNRMHRTKSHSARRENQQEWRLPHIEPGHKVRRGSRALRRRSNGTKDQGASGISEDAAHSMSRTSLPGMPLP